MKKVTLLVVSIVLGFQSYTVMAFDDELEGKAVYELWCMPCHGAGPKHPGTQALEAKYNGTIPAALEDRNDLTPEIIKYYVRNGISVMAPFRKTEISDEQLDMLANFLVRAKDQSSSE